jgi:hypothetical protein
MAGEFWLSEAQWGAIGPLLPKNQPGREGPTTGGSSAASSRSEDRLAVAGLPCRLRAFDDGLQSLRHARRSSLLQSCPRTSQGAETGGRSKTSLRRAPRRQQGGLSADGQDKTP